MSDKPAKKDRRLATQMQQRRRNLFTGRKEETAQFLQTLRALAHPESNETEEKWVFSIHGQGGIGKTTLLREFEAICQAEKIEYVYVDAQLEGGDSITDLIDLMRRIRGHFSQTRFQQVMQSHPFAGFDTAYQRYKQLEDRVRREQLAGGYAPPQTTMPQAPTQVALAYVHSTDRNALPLSAAEEHALQAMPDGYGKTPKDKREWLFRTLGNLDDAEFFMQPEPLLVVAFSDALELVCGDNLFVLMFDTYEKVDSFDPAIRDTFLAQLNIERVIVLAGRQSLYDRFDGSWRNITYFFELRPFTQPEVADYLQKRNLPDINLAERIFDFTHGWPLAVGLAVDAAERTSSTEEALALFRDDLPTGPLTTHEQRLQIVDHVTERLLNQVPPAERLSIWAAAVLTSFTYERLLALVGAGGLSQKQYARLIRYSFVRRAGAGFMLHDLVRDYILRSLKNRVPDIYESLHHRAAEYYLTQQVAQDTDSAGRRSEEWQMLTKEYLYHHIQADEHVGVQLLFKYIAEALYDRNYRYAQQLTQLISWTVPVNTMNLYDLDRCCIALARGDSAKACAILEADLGMLDLPRPQRYLFALTLGHLRMQWPYANYDAARNAFTLAYDAARTLCDTYALAAPLCNGEQQPAVATSVTSKPLVFMSYTSFDDAYETGALSQFREELRRALRFHSGEEVEIFQEGTGVDLGQPIQERISRSLREVMILVPIITPNYFTSEACRRDIALFLNRERQLGRNDLIIWIYYHPVEDLDTLREHPEQAPEMSDLLVRELAQRMGVNWQPFRKRSLNDPEVRSEIERIAQRIIAVMQSLSDTPAPSAPATTTTTDPTRFSLSLPAQHPRIDHYPTWTALALAYHGMCDAELGQYDQAIERLQAALNLAEQIGEQKTILRCIVQLGHAYRIQGSFAQAISLLERGLQYDLHTTPGIQLDLLQALGETYQKQAKYPQAIRYFQQACDLAKEKSEPDRLVGAWRMLAKAYRDMSKFEDAFHAYQAALRLADELRNDGQAADILSDLGLTYRQKGEYTQAIHYLEQSRDRYQAAGQATAVAELWRMLGDTYGWNAKPDAALAHYAEARVRYIELDAQEKLANLATSQGMLQRIRGDQASAVASYTEAYERYLALDRPILVAQSLWNLGIAHHLWGKFELALDYYAQARERYAALGQHDSVAGLLRDIGRTAQAQGNYAQAVAYFEQSRDLYAQLDQPSQVANLWHFLAWAYKRWRKFDQASECFHEARRHYDALGLPAESAKVLDGLGWLYDEKGEYAQAVTYFNRSLEIVTQLDLPSNIASLWSDLGSVYRNWGKYDEAIRHYSEAQRRYELLDQPRSIANTLWNLGFLYQEKGDYAQAITYLTQARERYSQLDHPSSVASLWQQLGQIYRLWNKYDLTLQHYAEAQQRYEQLGQRGQVADILLAIGQTAYAQGDYARAVEFISRSREENRALGYFHDVITSLADLAFVYESWGKIEQVIGCYEEALKLSIERDIPDFMAAIERNLGAVYRDQGQYARAIAYFTHSRDAFTHLNQPQDVAEIYKHLGSTYRLWNKFEQAIACYQEALQRYRDLDQRAAVANTLWEIGMIYRDQRNFAQAEQHFIQSRDLYIQLERLINIANLTYHLGINARHWEQADTALGYDQEALDRYRTLDNQVSAASTLCDIGWVYELRGDFPQALDYLRQSREIYTQMERPQNVAWLWDYMGDTYRIAGQFSEALAHYEEARQRFVALDQQADVASVIQDIGRLHHAQGSYAEAIRILSESRERYASLGKPHNVLNLWLNLEAAYHDWGQFEAALDCCTEARQIAHEQELYERDTYTLSKMGLIYQAQQRYSEALDLQRQSQEQYVRLGRLLDAGLVAFDIGETALLAGDREQAAQSFTAALTTALDMTYLRLEARAHIGLGWCAEPHDDTQAAAHFTRALEIYTNLDDPRFWGKAQLGMVRVAWRAGQYEAAHTRIAATFTQLSTRQRRRDMALLHKELGRFFQQVGEAERGREQLLAAQQLFAQLDNQYETEQVAALL
ncbi:tetratricopeptide repeat protein [Candidatus Oscillochloris fontis]|uniref:tetratricopeptide repeat protein n=1 Tax=Candidatus Oscillochloris fontis TaxID=2496868 RepID=UPI00101BB64B|nr:tetratricopeptide repeat protein [Candidatus Oscillochloris fontis]